MTAPPPSQAKEAPSIDLPALGQLLKSAPKDEVFRIKAIMYTTGSPFNSDGSSVAGPVATAATNGDASNGTSNAGHRKRYVLNWSFGRWTWTAVEPAEKTNQEAMLRMSIFTAQYESQKWTKRIESGGFVKLEGGGEGRLEVKRVQ